MSIICKGVEMPGPYLPCANPIYFSICVHLLSGCIFILSALVSRSFIGQALYGSWRQTPWWDCFQTFHRSGRFIEEIQEAYWSCYNACHKQKIQMATWKVISPGKSCWGFHRGLSGSVLSWIQEMENREKGSMSFKGLFIRNVFSPQPLLSLL